MIIPLLKLGASMVSPIFKTFFTLVSLGLLFFDAFVLGLDEMQLLMAVGGAASGAFSLNYFQQGIDWKDRTLKVISSTIAGVIFGTAINTYFNIQNPAMQAGVYYLVAFIALIFLRALLKVSDANADGIVTMLVRKVTNNVAGDKIEQTRIITTKATSRDAAKAHTEILNSEINSQQNNGDN